MNLWDYLGGGGSVHTTVHTFHTFHGNSGVGEEEGVHEEQEHNQSLVKYQGALTHSLLGV